MVRTFNHLAITLILAALSILGVTLASGEAQAQSEYRIRAGDTLIIEVLEDSSLNRSVVVLPDGRFSFPFAGSLRAGGRTVQQIEASLRSAIASNFTNQPNVFVAVQPAQRDPIVPSGPVVEATIDVFFLGEVNAPGVKAVPPGTTFLQALSQSGGLTRFAATKRVQLRRSDPTTGQQTISIYNYKALLDGASLRTDPPLSDGDVIIVPERRLFE